MHCCFVRPRWLHSGDSLALFDFRFHCCATKFNDREHWKITSLPLIIMEILVSVEALCVRSHIHVDLLLRPARLSISVKFKYLHYLMLKKCVRTYEARILVPFDKAFFTELPLFFGVCAEISGCFCEVLNWQVSISSIKPILTSNENLLAGVLRGPEHDAVTAPTFSCTWIPS